MALETGTFVSDLVVTNPPTTDSKQQGDDHLRLIKTVLKNTFPNATRAAYMPTTVAKSANFSTLDTDQNTIFLVTTTAGAVTVTLQTPAVGLGGWSCSFLKASADVNPILILPPSGSLTSGALLLTRTRRCIPGVLFRAIWMGSAWVVERSILNPVGSLIPFAGTILPFGYEWPNGQTLASVSTNYPDYNSVRGSGSTPDLRGRAIAGKDDMGGSSANRLTGGIVGGLNGDNFEATGGNEGHTLAISDMPAHQHTGTTDGQSNTHTHTQIASVSTGQYTAGGSNGPLGSGSQTGANSVDHTHTFTTAAQGGGGTHNNVQPTIIENYILVVE